MAGDNEQRIPLCENVADINNVLFLTHRHIKKNSLFVQILFVQM